MSSRSVPVPADLLERLVMYAGHVADTVNMLDRRKASDDWSAAHALLPGPAERATGSYRCGECEKAASRDAWDMAWRFERARRERMGDYEPDRDYGLDERMVCPSCWSIRTDDGSGVEEIIAPVPADPETPQPSRPLNVGLWPHHEGCLCVFCERPPVGDGEKQ